MIRNATQLKTKVRNLSGGDSSKALMLIRNYFIRNGSHRSLNTCLQYYTACNALHCYGHNP